MVWAPTRKSLSSLSVQSRGIWFFRISRFWNEQHLASRPHWSTHCDVQLAAELRFIVYDEQKKKLVSRSTQMVNEVNLHQTIRQFWESLTSTTTSNRLERGSSCRKSWQECFDPQELPSAGSVGGKSVDTPLKKKRIAKIIEIWWMFDWLFLDQTDPITSSHSRFRWVSWLPTKLRTRSLSWIVSYTCESQAYRWSHHAATLV